MVRRIAATRYAGILCTTAELEMIDNIMHTDLVNNERKIETPIYQSGSTKWKKGKHSRILPSGNMVYAAQTHSPFKSINYQIIKKSEEEIVQ